jgi:hypothetical protein
LSKLYHLNKLTNNIYPPKHTHVSTHFGKDKKKTNTKNIDYDEVEYLIAFYSSSIMFPFSQEYRFVSIIILFINLSGVSMFANLFFLFLEILKVCLFFIIYFTNWINEYNFFIQILPIPLNKKRVTLQLTKVTKKIILNWSPNAIPNFSPFLLTPYLTKNASVLYALRPSMHALRLRQ